LISSVLLRGTEIITNAPSFPLSSHSPQSWSIVFAFIELCCSKVGEMKNSVNPSGLKKRVRFSNDDDDQDDDQVSKHPKQSNNQEVPQVDVSLTYPLNQSLSTLPKTSQAAQSNEISPSQSSATQFSVRISTHGVSQQELKSAPRTPSLSDQLNQALSKLRKSRHNDEVVEQILKEILDLVNDNDQEEVAQWMITLGWYKEILTSMEIHMPRKSVQVYGYKVLRFVLHLDNDGRLLLKKARAIDVIISGMKEHASSREVQYYGVSVLEHFAMFSSTCKAIGHDGIHVCLTMILQHALDAEIITRAFNLLTILAWFESNKKKLETAGLRIVVEALERHSSDPTVQRHGIALLGNLIPGYDQEESALARTIQWLVPSNGSGGDSADTSTVTESNRRNSQSNVLAIIRLGVLRMTLDSMKRHITDKKLQHVALVFLKEICTSSQARHVEKAGAAEIVEMILKKHPFDTELLAKGNEVLGYISIARRKKYLGLVVCLVVAFLFWNV